MRILTVHNRYRRPGGEDEVFEDECALLERHGHDVVRFTAHNRELSDEGRLAMASRAVWNPATVRIVRRAIALHRIQLIHVHNTVPQISGSVYWGAARAGVPVVQTLHNYRLFCPSAVFFRDGRVCEDCAGKAVAWPGVVHGCYRDDRAATAVVAAANALHRLIGTWRERVSAYIALTPGARARFIDLGLPAGKVFVKPNFVDPDPGPGDGAGGDLLFVGRLTVEKGIETLLDTVERGVARPVRIIGDGPLSPLVARRVDRLPQVEWLGHLPRTEVLERIGAAAALVVPSEWYEPFGRVVVEAFARGTPVVAARSGALGELVDDGRTGFTFRPGDPADFADALRRLDSADLSALRLAARAAFEREYTAAANYRRLMAIYERALREVRDDPRGVRPAPRGRRSGHARRVGARVPRVDSARAP